MTAELEKLEILTEIKNNYKVWDIYRMQLIYQAYTRTENMRKDVIGNDLEILEKLILVFGEK